jgi:DNA polymerase-3 subunit epsilon
LAHNGYAVIDFETTGLSPQHHHRIIEVGIVHVAPDGTVEDSYETVINPSRDLGPTHIHQLRGADVNDAPSFADIAPQLVEHLRGRVLVAHNARFETTFLRHELAKLGVTSPITDDDALCTMKLATTYLPGSGRKLADCCAAFDIPLVDAHEALADARATAHLLSAYLEAGRDESAWWAQWGDFAAQAPWPVLTTGSSAPWMSRRRGVGVATPPLVRAAQPSTSLAGDSKSFLDRTTDRLRPIEGTGRELDYVAVLDRALSDGFLSVSESEELQSVAEGIGVTPTRRIELHHEYFDGIVDAAWADGVLTPAEKADIEAVAIMLDIAAEPRRAALEVRAATAIVAEAAPMTRLAPGDLVVLTGEMSEPRDRIEALLIALGVVVKAGITKKTSLLVAADPDSLSGKSQKARQYGIPIVGEAELRTLLRTP